MLRQRRLAEADDALQLADRAFALDQMAQHQQARLPPIARSSAAAVSA